MSAIVSPALSCASTVDAPRCGVTTTSSSSNSGESVHGSVANTSIAAPATCLARIASASAASSMIPPRATLMIRRLGFAFASRSAPIRPTVSGVLARCSVRKSASATSSSRPTRRTDRRRAASADTNGSYATSFIPNESARCATSLPIRPSPTMPRVLSDSSTPFHLERSQRPALSAEWACGTLRACDNRSAIVCSAADSTFDCGAFTTITPRSVAAATSTLSSPIPARPTTTRSVAASSTSAVTCVADRMMSPWAPTTAPSSPSASRSS